MVTIKDLYNEIAIYKAFFAESFTESYPHVVRSWSYFFYEKSFLANKTVAETQGTFGVLYDYSNILNVVVDDENYKNYENLYQVKTWYLPNKELTKTKLKEILANNAKVLSVAEKYQHIINERIELDSEF